MPNLLTVYATLYRFGEVWLHVDFLTKPTSYSNFKFNVHRKRWILLHIEIKSKDVIVHVEDEYNFYSHHHTYFHRQREVDFRHQKQYFLRKLFYPG